MRRGLAGTSTQTLQKIKFLQINVERKVAMHDVVMSKVHRDEDVLIISEPNRRICMRDAWLTDNRLDAAIVFMNKDIVVRNRGRGDGFVWVELSELVVYSCYCSSNIDYQYFETFIAELYRDIKLRSKQVIVGGDFNAKAIEWGSPTEDRRRSLMTEWLSEADMMVLNQGN